MTRIIGYVLAFLLYVILQAFLFEDLVLYHVARPAVFLIFLLTLPFATPIAFCYLIAFAMGVSVDLLSVPGTLGFNAFAAVLVMALRNWWVRVITSSNFRSLAELDFSNQTALWVASFILPLILVFHFSYFLLEDFSFSRILFTLWKVLASGLYTFVLCFLVAYVFYRK
ncbi:MAG: hypothetical protein OHK0039_24540 [Bacteroidia bacterium]